MNIDKVSANKILLATLLSKNIDTSKNKTYCKNSLGKKKKKKNLKEFSVNFYFHLGHLEWKSISTTSL